MEKILNGRPLVAGEAEGRAIVSRQPLSFWGGLNPCTGEVIDRRHELSGVIVAEKVFVLPQGKGSSTGSAVLVEGIRMGTAPAAIITARADPILALGAIVADELYHRTVPVLVLSQDGFDSINDGDYLVIKPDGRIEVRPYGEIGGDESRDSQ
jgi:hypothetical protein